MVLSILCCLDGLRLWQHPASTFLAYVSVLADACQISAAASGDPVLGSEGASQILAVVALGVGSLRGSHPGAVTRFVLNDMPVVRQVRVVDTRFNDFCPWSRICSTGCQFPADVAL